VYVCLTVVCFAGVRVSQISQVTGLRLFPVDKEKAFITSALARAALELPHPAKAEFGVDPLAEASKARLFIAGIVYKAKTGLSTFVLRLLLKRVLARVAGKHCVLCWSSCYRSHLLTECALGAGC